VVWGGGKRGFKKNKKHKKKPKKRGERFAQMIILPYPQIELDETEELSVTERGAGGFGSTGK